MDYRRTSLVLNRQNQSASHSHIYASFAGTGVPSRPPNGILADDKNTMWWDEERIEATVTRQYVVSQLRPDEAIRLDEYLRFGHGLTDDTYWEWIELKAKRIFLILVELGVPDQIFGVIDDSWDDDDLPIPMDQVERLALTYQKDEKLEKKFFHKQFNYLLRHLQKGVQLVYDDEEVVPLELAEKRPVGAVVSLNTHSNIDKVHLPGKPDEVFIRRRIPLGIEQGHMSPEDYLSGVETMKSIQHDHLTSLWASYVHENCAYLLLTPVNETTLKSVLTVMPQSIKILAKQDRRLLLLNWLHCLADALFALHHQGLSHRNIKPSTVMLDADNHIFLGDVGIFPTGERGGFEKDGYDYSAPENAPRPITSTPGATISRGATARRPTVASGVSHHTSILSSAASVSTSSNSNDSASIFTSHTCSNPSTSPTLNSPRAHQRHDPHKADIFSLGTIFLEILTILLKRTSKNFANHRASKNKTPGRGGGLPDSSFHKNLAQVESWMEMLAKDASKKEDKIYRGVPHIISLIDQMINPDPGERPTAEYVQQRLYTILNDYCNIGANRDGLGSGIHCETPKVKDSEWNFGFEELRLASQRAAAEACAAVAPQSTETRSVALGNGGVVYGIERQPIQLLRSMEIDERSIATKVSSSSEGKNKPESLQPVGRIKPKAKAWQAPIYTGLYLSHI